jgi:transporter family-2 protein
MAAPYRLASAAGRSKLHHLTKEMDVPTSFAFVVYCLAVCAGVSFVFQQAVNSNLRAEIGSPWWAGFVSYLGGTLAMLVIAILLQQPWPSMQTIGRSHWVSWSGGIFGAIYIGISILLLPRFGAATVVALIVAGQMTGSLAFDHFGLLGVPIHPVNMLRLTGAALVVVGVILIRF